MLPKKIVYLFGAGATHAEIINLDENNGGRFLDEKGLLISYLSKRVMKKAQSSMRFKEDVEEVTYRSGPVNIELLISLIESNRIPNVSFKVDYLKKLVEKDIKNILSPNWKKIFYLHKALFELHSLIENKEELFGIISLNYDDVLDEAFKIIHHNRKPNYCHSLMENNEFPLLKLHGSFNWAKITTYGKVKSISIIPLGINKNYLVPPYNFIWSRAFDILAQCDILRIIGCSLNQNDVGLVDLLFKAHLARKKHFVIEIINSQANGEKIKFDYGFFPGIVTPKDIEGSLIPDALIDIDPEVSNPFKIWLKAKAEKMLGDEIHQTIYLKKLFL